MEGAHYAFVTDPPTEDPKISNAKACSTECPDAHGQLFVGVTGEVRDPQLLSSRNFQIIPKLRLSRTSKCLVTSVTELLTSRLTVALHLRPV